MEQYTIALNNRGQIVASVWFPVMGERQQRFLDSLLEFSQVLNLEHFDNFDAWNVRKVELARTAKYGLWPHTHQIDYYNGTWQLQISNLVQPGVWMSEDSSQTVVADPYWLWEGYQANDINEDGHMNSEK